PRVCLAPPRLPTRRSSDLPESENRLDIQLSAVDGAVKAGVSRIVSLSFLRAGPASTFTFARTHFFTEAHIRSTGIGHTFLRPGLDRKSTRLTSSHVSTSYA